MFKVRVFRSFFKDRNQRLQVKDLEILLNLDNVIEISPCVEQMNTTSVPSRETLGLWGSRVLEGKNNRLPALKFPIFVLKPNLEQKGQGTVMGESMECLQRWLLCPQAELKLWHFLSSADTTPHSDQLPLQRSRPGSGRTPRMRKKTLRSAWTSITAMSRPWRIFTKMPFMSMLTKTLILSLST